MKQVINQQSLEDLLTVPRNHKLTENDIRYHGSLIPELKVLKKIKSIAFEITYKTKCGKNKPELIHQNSVNTHLFKPKFFRESKSCVLCLVSSRDVLVHTIRSLAIMNKHYIKNKISVSATDREDSYEDFCKNYKINDHIFIGRVESIINFLRMKWLLERNLIKKVDIGNFFRNIELSRLKKHDADYLKRLENKYLKSDGLSFNQIDKELNLRRLRGKSEYIEIANVCINNLPISIIQLPWGYSMSIEMMSYLINKRKGIKKIGIVGGVGYVGKEKASIDDVFEPENLILNNNGKIRTISIENEILALPKNNYIFKKNSIRGNIYSVIPQLGKISYTKTVRNFESIHAYDMEKAAFIKMIKTSKVKVASSYYIMDFPYTSLDFGGTYYSYQFLKTLFGRRNRGKYYCFERILHFLIT